MSPHVYAVVPTFPVKVVEKLTEVPVFAVNPLVVPVVLCCATGVVLKNPTSEFSLTDPAISINPFPFNRNRSVLFDLNTMSLVAPCRLKSNWVDAGLAIRKWVSLITTKLFDALSSFNVGSPLSLICSRYNGLSVPIPIKPFLSIRNRSWFAVSKDIGLALGIRNLYPTEDPGFFVAVKEFELICTWLSEVSRDIWNV